jgi:peptide-methionine (S)-S-oxide reductase
MKQFLIRIAAICAAGISFGAFAQTPAAPATPRTKTATAIFAGGCFWCTESDFDKVPGVSETTSGYINGMRVNPTYEEVSSGKTGHTEAVKVTYDPSVVTYSQLVEYFWKTIDPTVKNEQFCDRGTQYRSGFYALDEEQLKIAQASKDALMKSARFKEIHTEVVKASTQFYPAEEYHQDYYKKNPLRYKHYRTGCGRDARLKLVWGDAAK